MKQVQLIKLFVSCPSDLKNEVDSIRLIIEEINKTSGKENSYTLELLYWKQDTYTQIGDDVQDVINRQLDSEYDIIVSLFWQRIGTPTKRDKSGTIEEINRAIMNKKELLIYFKTLPPENLNLLDLKGLNRINTYKKTLTKKGILYKEYDSIDSFESLFRINVINLINDKFITHLVSKTSLSLNQLTVDKYSLINSIINEVEQKNQLSDLSLNIFQMVEQSLSAANMVTNSLYSITASVNDFSANMTKRTKELNQINDIKDNRLRLSKAQIVINLFSDELNEFNLRIDQELPIFSQNFLSLGPIYSNVKLFASNYDIKEYTFVNEAVVELRNSVETATTNGAFLLKEISKWRPMNSKFNKSKRETEEVLKNLTKVMLEGLKLLDEAIL